MPRTEKTEAVFGCAGDGGQLDAINQCKQSRKKVFLSQRNKEERLSTRRSNDYGAPRKGPTKHRAKRNNFTLIVARSFAVDRG
jgi:hypothetical protein